MNNVASDETKRDFCKFKSRMLCVSVNLAVNDVILVVACASKSMYMLGALKKHVLAMMLNVRSGQRGIQQLEMKNNAKLHITFCTLSPQLGHLCLKSQVLCHYKFRKIP